jgi:hypothetical protein
MGAISKKLAARFGRPKSQRGYPRRQVTRDVFRAPKDVHTVDDLIRSGYHPLLAAYAAAQNFTSFFAEAMSEFPELDPYCRIVAAAEEEYMPDGPPMSPLTRSYFTSWAFFDVRFGRDKETIGTCLLDLADVLGMDSFLTETIRRFQASRLGIYEHVGTDGPHVRLKELLTADEFTCHPASAYRGRAGELWYVRVCPPLLGQVDYHLAYGTPYVLMATKANWTAYLNRSLRGADAANTRVRLHEHLKFGKGPNYWNEFVFQAYHHHLSNAIFLAGLPDVKGSRPHES